MSPEPSSRPAKLIDDFFGHFQNEPAMIFLDFYRFSSFDTWNCIFKRQENRKAKTSIHR